MKRFDVLDSWRGIAACLVALLHLRAYGHFYEVPFVRNGYLFVDFFFVLSGFVIAANYQYRLLNGFSIWRFLYLRVGRLFPLHLFVLFIFVFFKLFQGFFPVLKHARMESPEVICANALLLHGLGMFDSLSLNGPSWSISTEFWAYVVFAASLVALRARAVVAALAFVVLSPVLIYAAVGHIDTTYDYGFIRCLYGFAAGVLTWLAYRRAPIVKSTALEVAAVIGAVVFVTLAGATPLSIFAPFVFSIVVLVFAFEGGRISSLLSKPVFLYFGTISYSIYMTHFFIAGRIADTGKFLRATTALDGKTLAGTSLWQGDLIALAYIPLVICVATLTYRHVEAPSRRWFRGERRESTAH